MQLLIKQQACAGFFSDFNTITSSLLHCMRNNIADFNVVWNNWRYQEDTTKNLFNDFFIELPVIKAPTRTVAVNELEEFHIWKPVMEKDIFFELNNTLVKYNYFDNSIYKECLQKASSIIQGNCLGVHARFTDATQHRPFIPLTAYFEAIEEVVRKNKSLNSLFIATDDERVIEQFIHRYGENTVKYNTDITRSKTDKAIHSNPANSEKAKIAKDVVLDGVCLSLCRAAVHTSSNVIGYSFMLNPELESYHLDKDLAHY